MVKRPDKPYVTSKLVKGRTYWYFRRGGTYTRLPDDPDSREFDEAYWAIRSGKAKRTPKVTYDAVIQSYYQSPRFKAKAEGTRKEYRRTLERIREKNGGRDFTKLTRQHVEAARDAYADTWRKANDMVIMLSVLSRHAMAKGWIDRNPAEGVEKLTGATYEPWPQDKLEAYERYCRRHGLRDELTAFMLGTGTGQRLGDVLKMRWDDLDGEFFRVVQEKTGTRLWVACPAFLTRYLSELPRAGDYIMARDLRRPMTKSMVQKRVGAVREAIEATGYVIHGWRYNAAVALAEAGCSDSEIQSVTGHRTLAMVQKYRSAANQKKLSKQAQERRK